MLFFVNEQGTTVNMVNEPVNVGSTNANEVILVAPISQANQVTIAFRLPNGATVSERIMSLLEQQLVINNKTYSVYRYLMDGTITAVSGICKVQFKIYQYQFTNDDSVRNAVLATYTSNFVIREGIFATFPETPTSTIYQQILTYLATLNPNYLVQSVDYVNENSLIEPETWISGVHNKIVCYDPTSLNAYGVTSACELSLANLFGGQNKPLFICNTEMADVYTDEDATNIGTGAKIENISTNLHTGKIQINISNCKYDTVIKVAHLENSSWVADGTFVVRAANGSNVNIICGIQKTNVTAFAVFQDYNATRELDESKGDDYLPPKTAHDNDPSITEFQGFTKERYQINSVYTWAYTQDGDVWDMVGGTLQLKMLNGNIWSFPDFDYNATKLACKEYKDLAHKWANYSDDSDTPSVTNNAYYYSEIAHGWANNYQVGTPSATNNAMYFAGQAATSAVNASNSETAANNSKLAAQTAEANAHAWATGDSTDGTSPSSTNNAKYFADNAHDDADSAETDALKSEGYAVGTQNGTPAQEGEPYYHDNAKWYNEDLKSQKFAKDLTADLNSTTYVVTLKLYSSTTHIDSGGDSTLLATQTFDLPIESAIVNIQYVDTEEHPTSLLFTLQSGATTYVPIGSIISGLATETYVNGEIDKIKNGTYAVGILDGAIVAQGNTYPVSGLVDVINSTLYWKHASHAVDASNLLVSGVAKSGATIQGEIDSKIPKANIDTSIPATPLDTNVPSTKLLNDTVEGVKTALENGSIKAGHAKVADNLTPYSEDSGTTQENPFISQGTGTDNNSVIVTTGVIAKQLEKQGNTVVKNSKMVLNNSTNSGISITKQNDDSITITGTATAQAFLTYYNNTLGIVAGHKYLIRTFAGIAGRYFSYISSPYVVFYNEWNIFTPATSNNSIYYAVTVQSGETVDLKVYPMFIDLTQWFGGNDNIPNDLLSNPSHFSWYYNGSLAYDAGSLQNCNGRYLECGQGRNLFNPATVTSGKQVNGTTGELTTKSGRNASDYMLVVPNRPIYSNMTSALSDCGYAFYDKDKNFISGGTSKLIGQITAPSNAVWFRCTATQSDLNAGVTISLYYTPEEGGEGYNQHYDYIAPIRIDTGNETLKAFDKKLPSGVIERNTGEVDLSTLNWTYDNQYEVWTVSNFTQAKWPVDNNTKANIKSDLYTVDTVANIVSADRKVNTIALSYSGSLDVCNGSSTTTPSGHIQIELSDAYKTTEQGTAFSEYAPINDYSYMAWLDTDGNLVSIPQGCKLFYPVDYKGFTDDLVMYTNGNAAALAKNESITDTALNARGYYKMQDLSASAITPVANLTFAVKKVIVCGKVVTMTIRATNGDTIVPAGSTLFTLDSSIRNSVNVPTRCNDNIILGTIIASSGYFVLPDNLPASAVVAFSVSYCLE